MSGTTLESKATVLHHRAIALSDSLGAVVDGIAIRDEMPYEEIEFVKRMLLKHRAVFLRKQHGLTDLLGGLLDQLVPPRPLFLAFVPAFAFLAWTHARPPARQDCVGTGACPATHTASSPD